MRKGPKLERLGLSSHKPLEKQLKRSTTDMITVYREIGKPFSDEISIIIMETKGSFEPTKAVCGGCGIEGHLDFYCTYARWLDVLEDGAVESKEILLDRYQCGICGKTHVVAPGELVIPYSRHSLGFIIAVLEAYAKREKPVRKIAEDFMIVVSTLYVWIEKFRDHYELFMGKLEGASGDTGEQVEAILVMDGLPQRLFIFVETHRACFLQSVKRTGATRFFTLRGALIFFRGASP